MLHKIQHAHSGGVLHGAHPGWLRNFVHTSLTQMREYIKLGIIIINLYEYMSKRFLLYNTY